MPTWPFRVFGVNRSFARVKAKSHEGYEVRKGENFRVRRGESQFTFHRLNNGLVISLISMAKQMP
jgi:hypothetical protein